MRNAEQIMTEYNALPVPVAHMGTGIKCFFRSMSYTRKTAQLKKQLREFLEVTYGKELSPAVKNITWDMACTKAEAESHANNFVAIENAYRYYIENAGDYLMRAGEIMGR